MVRQDRSSNKKKRASQPIIASSFSIDEVLDTFDTGDETQHRFRYQHAYGVILLLAALSGEKEYTDLWCEHHEDLLGQRNDGFFDAYQIKTRRDGLWNLSDDPLRDSIKRFVEVEQRFPGKIKKFCFVSNTRHEDSIAQNKIGRNTKKFLQTIRYVSSPTNLESPFDVTFEELRLHCGCDVLSLMTVLKKLDFLTGPGLDSFEAEIALDHLSVIRECHSLPAKALGQLVDDLIARVYKASCLSITDPARHWFGLDKDDRDNPKLQAKRISVESILIFIRENKKHLLNIAKDTSIISKRLKEALDMYLNQSFDDDQVAKLDQAGETDSERTTLLHQVFVDLELQPRSDQPQPPRLEKAQLSLFTELEQTSVYFGGKKPLSAMDCFLKEMSLRIVIIGGPGQGKSTLGQYLAQIHRAVLQKREKELYRDTVPQKNFQPKIVRIPFRIVLKYFAQWLADGPVLDTVEAYIAEQIGLAASRPEEIDAACVQDILKAYPALLILDGLDEVTDQALCGRMLTCVERFLARAERLEADLQIIATSRPQNYRDQFTPKLFWHLELQPLSIEKTREYATCWAHVKVPSKEEQRRIKETLEECLNESHTRSLLSTPLQVTIILLIIKDGGRPPAQREELFQQYWTTILGREKSKAKGMIRTGDTRLFGLHAFLGYLLHRNAIGKNVRSLFPADEFERIVCDFLKSSDNISPPEEIQHRAAQMVEDARLRLVLLVEPEPGFFGFELRSLQEFFAGAYLAQTARDTEQRFARLRAIAYSEHWRNVTLFCAGRIVRDFGGEAANILEAVCRHINRDPQDTYLCRGAWLALDIAADGIFTTNNRNLQYSALEIALTVTHTGMTTQQRSHLVESVLRVSLEDRRDILGKLLKQKLPLLPSSCLPPVLELYGQFISTKQDFTQALEVVLSTNRREQVLEALDMGFQKKVSPQWLALQLETYWQYWINKQPYLHFIEWWYTDSQYTQKLVSVLSLSESLAIQFMDRILLSMHYRNRAVDINISLIKKPETYADQIIALLQCVQLSDSYREYIPFAELHIGKSVRVSLPNNKGRRFRNTEISISSDLSLSIDQLIARLDLLPQLRVCLWTLYWKTHGLKETMVKAFVEESRTWAENKAISTFLQREFRRFLPLIRYTQGNRMGRGQDTALLSQNLSGVQEFPISVSRKVGEALQKGLSRISHEEQLAIILHNHYSRHLFPELALIADQLKVNSEKLIEVYASVYIDGSAHLSPKVLKYLFLYIDKGLGQNQKMLPNAWILSEFTWNLDHEAANQGMLLLHTFLEMVPRFPNIIQSTLLIFLKLITFDDAPLSYASKLFACLEENTYAPLWYTSVNLLNIPQDRMKLLSSFITDKDARVRQGAITFWAELIESVIKRTYASSRRQPFKLDGLSFDCDFCLSLINETDVTQKTKGIVLLIYSHLPIKEAQYFTTLLKAMKQMQDDEIEAWVLFLENVPINRSERKAWIGLLETLLDTPQSYSYEILTAAMDRYIQLTGVIGPDIQNEQALDLPLLALPRMKK